MESTQLLSNDFYTRAFSRQKQEESDEEFVEDDELEALREQHEQIGVDVDEDEGSQSDYEGDYEETQLLEQYNAHYNKTEYGQKTGQKTGHSRAGFLDSNQESSGEEEGDCEQTQLLETYNSSSYNKAEYEKEQLMQVPGKSKGDAYDSDLCFHVGQGSIDQFNFTRNALVNPGPAVKRLKASSYLHSFFFSFNQAYIG